MRHYSYDISRMSPKPNFADKTNNNWLPWQRPLGDRETNFRSIIYSHSSTNPENLAKIGLADFKIAGLAEIVKEETAAKHV